MACTKWDLLVSGDELSSYAKERNKTYIEDSFRKDEVSQKLSEGWTIAKEYKTSVKMTKPKKVGDAFEDELWSIFFNMGFTTMNSTNKFELYYTDSLSKQLDIVAIDEETCIFIECKEAKVEGTKQNFNFDISEISSKRDKLYAAIREKFPERKCKYIFATKNYSLGDQDKNRLKEDKIPYFDYSAVLYYKALASHLGKASRFQLLGSLFAGQTIIGMDSTIPAIRGYTPEGIKYYTFLIEPEKLLKLGYVLHRTNANNDYDELLPSYQRLIKKDRLKSVQEFVNNKGFFPNSVIISFDTKKEMQFDFSSGSNQSSLYKMGTLHLPQTYQSAYIIDGQHRIYGYSDSKHAGNNTIPVVAFENLSKDKQLKLFMEINENQKAISPKLRGLLEIDVYYNDENIILRKKALLGKIAKRLGEDPKSPLKGRIIIGEDAQTKKCCITMEYIKSALETTDFFNTYKKNGTIDHKGIFDTGNNDETMDIVYPLIRNFFTKIAENSSEWNSPDSYIPINNTTVALIGILGDFVDIIVKESPELANNIPLLSQTIEDNYLIALLEALDSLPAEKRQRIIKAKGGSAKKESYRILQMAVHEKEPLFTNDDIENYYMEHEVDYNDQSKSELVAIQQILSNKIRELYGQDVNWQFNHMAEEHQKEFTNRLNEKQIAMQRNGNSSQINVWEELTLIDIQKIIKYGSHWSDNFKDYFAEKHYNKTKLDFVTIMQTLYDQNNNISNGNHVTRTNYMLIHEMYTALISEGN